ncbi:MAG: ChbG/HpnK family deacetylase, partial [Planctomycetota bacterium]
MTSRRFASCGLSLLILFAGASSCVCAQDSGINLIIRGDDIGSSHAANVACIRSYTEGIMTSVEVMVP